MMISLVSLSDHRAKNARNNQLSWKRLACREPLKRRCVIVGEKTTVDLVTSLKQRTIVVIAYMSYGRRLIAILVIAVLPVLVRCIHQLSLIANLEFITLRRAEQERTGLYEMPE